MTHGPSWIFALFTYRASILVAPLLLVAGCAEVEIDTENAGGSSGEASDDPTPSRGSSTTTSATGANDEDDLPDPVDVRRVFVTSMRFTGDLGGVTGADDLCTAAATEARLSGTWRAWLGTNATAPATRLTHSDVPYVRLDGVQIAIDWTDLTDGTLAAPIAIDETGTPVPSAGSIVWTAADWMGNLVGGTCFEWTENGAGGFYGDANAADDKWAHTACQPCTETAHLYCFEDAAPDWDQLVPAAD